MRTETISGYLDRLAAGGVPAGGGSGAAAPALLAAQAAALLASVAREDPQDGAGPGAGADEARRRLTARVRAAADGLREMALKLADDEAGSGAVADARARGAVIMIAEAGVELAGKLLPVTDRAALPDLATALETARAAARSARTGVEALLTAVTDPAAHAELTALTAGVDPLTTCADHLIADTTHRLHG
ncbi:formimidoyltetrahydrofolate cyclodeaminase [Streptomyces sp. NPDC060194]|uniref:formimidoyltetrahydrofolate cyclodeaminase n=1 Tax=Streptomyces sp. NPDC060194 TaxID=3347069 RepID=UPI0036495417